MKRFILSIMVLLLIPVFADATTYYVCKLNTDCNAGAGSGWSTGNDGNNGTAKATPWASPEYALSQASGGDTIVVGDGTYTDHDADGYVILSTADGNGSYITLKAENKWLAILDGETTKTAVVRFSNGAGYISIEDFEIKSGKYYGYQLRDDLTETPDLHHMKLIGNKIHDTGWSTVNMGRGVHDILIDSNYIYDWNSGTSNGHGLYMVGYAVTVQNNIFVRTNTSGRYLMLVDGHNGGSGGEQTIIAVNNTFVNKTAESRDCVTTDDSWGTYAPDKMVFRNNAFYGCGDADDGGNDTCIEIESFAVDSDWIITNNVGSCEDMIHPKAGGTPTESANKVSSDGVTKANLAAQFTDYTNNDYSLVTPRPSTEWLMDTGTATDAPADDYIGTARPQGAADDIGAYEFEGDPPVTITNAAPSGTLTCTSNPRNVTMTWDTTDDAPCNCRIGPDDLGDYDDMPIDSVTNTDAATHSDTESFVCGDTYTRYVYCEDTLGNEVGEEIITFTIEIGTPPPPVSGVSVSGGSASGGSIQ